MEQKNNTQPQVLMFGLSPKATLINSIVISILAQLIWAIVVTSQVDLNSIDTQPINVPWYYDLPLSVLSILMLIKWIEFRFNIAKFEMTFRAFRYRFIYGLLLMTIFQMLLKVFFVLLILSLR